MAKRIELSKRQVGDIEGYIKRFRSEDEEDPEGVACELAGYVNSALHRQSGEDAE